LSIVVQIGIAVACHPTLQLAVYVPTHKLFTFKVEVLPDATTVCEELRTSILNNDVLVALQVKTVFKGVL
jgi:hypothetical protein